MLGEIGHLGQDGVRVACGVRETGERNGRASPVVLVVHLGGADPKAVLRPFKQSRHQAPFVLQPSSARQAQFNPDNAYDDQPNLQACAASAYAGTSCTS